MNVLKKMSLLIMLSFLLPLSALARDFSYTYQGQTLTYTVLDEEAKTCETKAGTYLSSGYHAGNNISGELSIPEIAEDESGNKYTVTTIGAYSFYKCNEITGDLIIPNSVVTIEAYAFSNCSGFTGSLTIGNSVTTIGSDAFYCCSGLTGDLIIPESVTAIGGSAFSNCSGFRGNLTIGNSVATIGSCAFQNCSGLTGDLILPESITSIGGSAFSNCSGLTGELTIPNSITSIERSAFSDCSGFTGSLTIGNSVTTIGNNAFEGCSSFTGNLIIPESVISIGEYAFRDCSGFNGTLTLGSSVTAIKNYAFQGCSGFTGSLIIPSSVTELGIAVFNMCTGFTGTLTISGSITDINYALFMGCSGFTQLNIPESVIRISGSAFKNCSGFTGDLIIPKSVTTIEQEAFYGCNGFTGSLILSSTVTEIGKEAFRGATSFADIQSLNPIPPSKSADYVFFDTDIFYKNIPLYVPDGSVDAYKAAPVWGSFQQIYPLSKLIIIPPIEIKLGTNTLELSVGKTAQLTATVLPDNATDKSVTWTSSDEAVASVDADGFIVAHKPGKTQITASTVNDLNAYCEVTVTPRKPENGDDFTYTYKGQTLTYTITDNETMTCETKRGDRFSSGNYVSGILPIPEIAYNGDIPFTVTRIGDFSFVGRTELTGELNIPNSVVSIGLGAFMGCTGLTGSLIIPESVTFIEAEAFYKCGFSDSLVIGNSVKSIGDCSFEMWDNFNGPMVIGSSVSSIGGFVFTGLDFTYICSYNTIPPAMSSEYPFFTSWIFMETPLYVPDESVESYREAEVWKEFKSIYPLSALITINATDIKLQVTTLELSVDNVFQLTATVLPEDATDKTVTWSSSDETVATVDAGGKVTAVKEGTAIISVTTSNGLTASCAVTVKAKPSGIDGIEGEGENVVRVEDGTIIAPEGCEVYDLNGRRVSASGLRPGIYIVRISGTKAVKVMVK